MWENAYSNSKSQSSRKLAALQAVYATQGREKLATLSPQEHKDVCVVDYKKCVLQLHRANVDVSAYSTTV